MEDTHSLECMEDQVLEDVKEPLVSEHAPGAEHVEHADTEPEQPPRKADPIRKKRGPPHRLPWGGILRTACTCLRVTVRVIITVEVLAFGIDRLQALRHGGRRERWGPGISNSETDSSEDSSGTDVATSSEVAEVLLEYLEGKGEEQRITALTEQEVSRGLAKIKAEDLEELGVDEQAGREVLQLLQQTALRMKKPEPELSAPTQPTVTGRVSVP
mmetsp:Transcript_11380/g.19955  ORF Transcript_11380/g.19955 Transcript_11380/m.19955 type:complete len:215 (+) Transcript_11380:64-708(+)